MTEPLKEAITKHLSAQIDHLQPVSGGSINQAAYVSCANGNTYFIKWNASAPPHLFDAERHGLQLLRAADTEFHIPEPIASGQAASTHFLILEWMAEGRPQKESHESLGRQLANLHRTTNDEFGLNRPNYIGKLPQPNEWHAGWSDFFITQRLQPQFSRALATNAVSESVQPHFEQLCTSLPSLLPSEPPALLHGDLWSGNYFFDSSGTPCLFDPAVYYGHREVDLAFTHLFGGFSDAFYQSYNNAFPLTSGFDDRIAIYNLYPLLVHANLFGGHYGKQVARILQQF